MDFNLERKMKMKKSAYQQGYDDGYRLKPQGWLGSVLDLVDYTWGYKKGKEDKAVVDYWSDEALGIFD